MLLFFQILFGLVNVHLRNVCPGREIRFPGPTSCILVSQLRWTDWITQVSPRYVRESPLLNIEHT